MPKKTNYCITVVALCVDAVMWGRGDKSYTPPQSSNYLHIQKQMFFQRLLVPTGSGKTGVPALMELVNLFIIHAINEEIIEQLVSTQQEELSNY